MLFTEKDLLNAFKSNVDNKGWIYFVGNPESNAKFIIDYMKANKEKIKEEELDKLAKEEAGIYGMCFLDSGIHTSRNREGGFQDGFKTCYRKVMEDKE